MNPTESSRWPVLYALAGEYEATQRYRATVENGTWLFSPRFLDCAEKMLSGPLGAEGNISSSQRKFVQSLCARMCRQKSDHQIISALIEIISAGWLAERNVLHLPPGPSTSPDTSILDLGMKSQGEILGVEVKSDIDAFESEFLSGKYPNDQRCIRAILSRTLGENFRVSFEWLGSRPSRSDWGEIRTEVLTRVEEKLVGTQPFDESETLTIRVDLKNPIGSTYGILLRVSRAFVVSVQMSHLGANWGRLVERVQSHSRQKARNTEHDFFLLYVTRRSMQSTFDRVRLQWAARELRQDQLIPNSLRGVLLLELVESEAGIHLVSSGFTINLLPEHDEKISKALGLSPLPQYCSSVSAGEIWDMLKEDCSKVSIERINPEQRVRWVELREKVRLSTCESKGAGDLLVELCILASESGTKLGLSANYGGEHRRFPSPASTLFKNQHIIVPKR